MAKKKSKRKTKIIFILKAGLIAILVWAGAVVAWAATFEIPDLNTFYERQLEQSTKIYDRTGEIVLHELYKDAQRTIIPFEEMSRTIKNATVAIEDERFYEHAGIRPLSFLRAVFVNVKELSFRQGGSTITQQVVKNSILTNEKTISRKLKEWVLALKLEREITKNEILALYLNEVPYGGSVYGIQEAARNFFGKDASELTLAESAYLASLPQAPTYYSPYGNHREALEERKNTVLSQMLKNSFITQEEYETARSEEVVFQDQENSGIKAPHFVFFVGEYLERTYGPQVLRQDGLRVITTLDWELQERAQDVIRENALRNSEVYDAENAALVAIDPQTGQILSMVGSRNYFDELIPGKFNAAIAHRQPGSAFKPFVYATAFKKGYLPDTVVYDLRTQFSTSCSSSNLTSTNSCYSPVNYDGSYIGAVSLRDALAQSRNVPSVKTLYLAGLQDSLRTARDMGIKSLGDAGQYGLTLVLGGGEVSLLDMTSAYGVFANDGVRNPYAAVLRIEDSEGNILEEYKRRSERVADEYVVRLVSDILSDNEARTPAFGPNSPLYFPEYTVAAKTGTTNNYKDAWIVGYTPKLAVGTWAGNNDNRSMNKEIAGFVVAPMWHEFMEFALSKYPAGSFRAPAPVQRSYKPMVHGLWEGADSPHSILHWVDKNNPLGSPPSNPARDPQYELWEYPVRRFGSIPAHSGAIENVEIIGLSSVYSMDAVVEFSVASARSRLSEISIYLNDTLIGSIPNGTNTFSFTSSNVGARWGRNTLRLNTTFEGGKTSTLNTFFEVRDE